MPPTPLYHCHHKRIHPRSSGMQENMHDLLLPKGRSSLVAKAVVFLFLMFSADSLLVACFSLDV